MFQTVFSLFAQQRLGLDARATSYVFTYAGILVVAVQGGGIGFLTCRFSEKQLILDALNVSISSALTKSVYPEEVGGTLGLSSDGACNGGYGDRRWGHHWAQHGLSPGPPGLSGRAPACRQVRFLALPPTLRYTHLL